MNIQINPQSKIPVCTQIVRQVMFAVSSGNIHEGEKLPAVRVWADELNVDPNTVTKAYQQLSGMCITNNKRGDGVYIADGAQSLAIQMAENHIKETFGLAVREAFMAGIFINTLYNLTKQSTNEIMRGEIDLY